MLLSSIESLGGVPNKSLGRALEWGLCVWGWRGKSRVESEGGGVWCGQLALGAWVPHSGVLWLFLSFLVFSWSFLFLFFSFLFLFFSFSFSFLFLFLYFSSAFQEKKRPRKDKKRKEKKRPKRPRKARIGGVGKFNKYRHHRSNCRFE